MNMNVKTPWHLWAVGGVSLLWNCIGASDYTFTKMKSQWYLVEVSGFKPEQIAWIESFPLWANIAWACGVWGALTGSILLLLRSRHAVLAFAVSLAGLVVNGLYQFVVAEKNATEMLGGGAIYFTLFIGVTIVITLLYARAMAAKGVLR